MQTRSSLVYRHPSPMKNPLLRMLWWERVAPLGKPVVPLVYWMLIGSSKDRLAARSSRAPGPEPSAAADAPAASSSCHCGVPREDTCSSWSRPPLTPVVMARASLFGPGVY